MSRIGQKKSRARRLREFADGGPWHGVAALVVGKAAMLQVDPLHVADSLACLAGEDTLEACDGGFFRLVEGKTNAAERVMANCHVAAGALLQVAEESFCATMHLLEEQVC